MGADRNTYFGVYLRVNNTEEIITEKYYVNASGNKAKTKYNSETGEEHKLVSKEKIEICYFDQYDVLEDFEDSFFSPEYVEGNDITKEGYTTLLSNSNDDLFATYIEECRTFDLSVGFSIDKAVEAFEECYMAELKILRDNKVEFTFHCGIVNYAH